MVRVRIKNSTRYYNTARGALNDIRDDLKEWIGEEEAKKAKIVLSYTDDRENIKFNIEIESNIIGTFEFVKRL